MRATRKIRFFSLLVIATLLVQNASATLLSLPDSSYAEAEGNWQGYRIYEEDDFYVRIDFTVYDTQNLLFPEETAFAEELDIAGQYIYAYQIFNRITADEDVWSFAIFGIGEYSLEVVEKSIGSQDDEMGGVEPADAYFTPSNSRGVWEFNGDGGYILAGEHSWFLVFGSNSEPVPGSYEIKGPEVDQPVPPEIPEPVTLTLLGFGGALMFVARRRKSVQ